ncbi:uncharacterized protein LOC142325296 isoform X2 [Lycorma delicatula]|uniref:uncharacterized protein LOC142325296 isoform X2 n=1 Tax=Lycorma delicatula TaxID=130591 RepID=UPI003F511EA7
MKTPVSLDLLHNIVKIYFALGFGEVLTLCACLLGCVPAVFSLPTSMSAPVKPDLLKEKPMWINPCTSGGVATQINETDGSDMEHIPPNSVIFNRIVAIAKNARNEFDPLFNSFIQTYFKSEDNVRSLQIKPSYMPWLPLFAKDETKVKEEIAAAISGSDYRTALQNSYEWLQRVAVGLEQLYLDQYNSNAEFHKEFESALQAMKLVFCEIETAMLEFDVPKRKDIQRDVMTDDERNISGDPRNLRDWIILLTYTNMLDYVITVFDHFEHNSS